MATITIRFQVVGNGFSVRAILWSIQPVSDVLKNYLTVIIAALGSP
jgi:hypothetical protein